jgi:preprotein translocase subunit SecE
VARDRKRAKQRQGRRRVREGAPATPTGAPPIRSDLSDALGHVSGEVDEFDAALVRGAGGASAVPGVVPGQPEIVDADALDGEAERSLDSQLVPAGSGGNGGGSGSESLRGGASGDAEGGRALEPSGARAGNRAVAFLRASWAELQRVQWPDRRQVTQATAVVLGFVALAGAYLGLADYVAKQIVEFIL